MPRLTSAATTHPSSHAPRLAAHPLENKKPPELMPEENRDTGRVYMSQNSCGSNSRCSALVWKSNIMASHVCVSRDRLDLRIYLVHPHHLRRSTAGRCPSSTISHHSEMSDDDDDDASVVL